jgi:predicted nucleotidyltransferase
MYILKKSKKIKTCNTIKLLFQMTIFLKQHKEFLVELLDANVEFILIGGYAVIFHGYVRTTGDMDLWLKPDNINKEKFLNVLSKSGFSIETLAHVRQSDFTQTLAFHIGNAPDRIDFLTKLAGITFEDAILKVDELKLEEFVIPVLNLNDLIINKMLTNRTKDKADIEELQKIHKLNPED